MRELSAEIQALRHNEREYDREIDNKLINIDTKLANVDSNTETETKPVSILDLIFGQ